MNRNDYNPCKSNPCFNNGLCYNRQSSYECQCPSGYYGTNCQVSSNTYSNLLDVRSCSPNPCMNGGSCQPAILPFGSYGQEVSSSNDIVCLCLEGFSGRYCEINKNLNCQDKDATFCRIIKTNGYCLIEKYSSVCQASCNKCS